MAENYPPELIQALSDAGLLDDRLALQEFMLKQAAAKANTPMPQGRTPEPGYLAPHPLEVFNAVMQQGQGQQQEQAVQSKIAEMLRQYQVAGKQRALFDQAQEQEAEAQRQAEFDRQNASVAYPQTVDQMAPKPKLIPKPRPVAPTAPAAPGYNPMSPNVPGYNPLKMPWE